MPMIMVFCVCCSLVEVLALRENRLCSIRLRRPVADRKRKVELGAIRRELVRNQGVQRIGQTPSNVVVGARLTGTDM